MDYSKDVEFSHKVRKKLKDKDLLIEELRDGKNGKEILEVTEKIMEKWCHEAYLLIKEKKYIEASCAFLFLVALSMEEEKYWLGLGMSFQFMHDYETAIDVYEMAALCDINNPEPYFYLAKCFFAIHEKENALRAFDMVIEMAEENPQYAEIREQAEHARSLLT